MDDIKPFSGKNKKTEIGKKTGEFRQRQHFDHRSLRPLAQRMAAKSFAMDKAQINVAGKFIQTAGNEAAQQKRRSHPPPVHIVCKNTDLKLS